MKKKITKHTIGPMHPSIVGICNKIQEKNKKNPKILGIVFSNEGAKGREPLFDVSYSGTKDIFAYWKDEKEGVLEISASEPGYEIKAPKRMEGVFAGARLPSSLELLDVSHLDVSLSNNFRNCFREFGRINERRIIGLDKWNMENAIDLAWMFENFCPENKEINLNVSGWNLQYCHSLAGVFDNFGKNAKTINIAGLESWRLPKEYADMDAMFRNFGANANYFLDLTNWNFNKKVKHEWFAQNTFFKIKEPVWSED